ncbi:MAG: hypothetical protein K0R61_157 [Microvirga sp.]|jgi:hypothetical protein|nr:hypothetical protein [Microvirga sp.]
MEYAFDPYMRALRIGRLVIKITRRLSLMSRVHMPGGLPGERLIHSIWGLHVAWVGPEYRLRRGVK